MALSDFGKISPFHFVRYFSEVMISFKLFGGQRMTNL